MAEDMWKSIVLWLLVLTTVVHIVMSFKYYYKTKVLTTLQTLARMYATDLEVDFAASYYTGGHAASPSEAAWRRLIHYERAKQLAELAHELERASWKDTVRIKRGLSTEMQNYWEAEDR